ncbi:hypothetical protein [Streptomyces luteogriseus]|uniref:hypothetical protein n=1 Tax=Streptomyces luteogriseus TaxID=68233 RepID=UPI002E3247E7|nr:hypothetical protein [Streptomyces luteogriseus]WTJ32901.1 hypothetical protein OID52_40635 [Streptomyces luteogriseus]
MGEDMVKQATRLMARGTRPPGSDTLRHTPRRGLAAVPDPCHREMVGSVLASGLVDEMIAFTEAFDVPVDVQQVRADAEVLGAEFDVFNPAGRHVDIAARGNPEHAVHPLHVRRDRAVL